MHPEWNQADRVKSLFEGRKLLIATRHRKEKVLIPPLKNALGILPLVPEDFDSDAFGTFSGEIERTADPLTTLRRKCMAAMELYGCDLAIASEGSFGPHPDYPFLPGNEEWLLFRDDRHQLEIIARELSLETNFSSQEISSESELLTFASKAGFPSHGLILRAGKDIIKGIQGEELLRSSFRKLREAGEQVTAETDMRALYNPGRMLVIERAAVKLLDKLLCACPGCGMPGFGITRIDPGLPCAGCGSATALAERAEYHCKFCGHTEILLHPEGKSHADPASCFVCNP
jgi:hypothetical protein